MKNILIVLDSENNTLKSIHKEILSHFRKMSDNVNINILIFCSQLKNELKNDMNNYYFKNIFVIEDEKYEIAHGSNYIDDILRYVEKLKVDVVAMGSNTFSKDISSILAERINGELIGDLLDIKYEENKLKLKKSVYGSNFYEKFELCEEKAVISIRPNIYLNEPIKGKENIYETEKKLSSNSKIEIVGKTESEIKEVPVTEAEIIIAGGYGLKKKEDMKMLYDLSKIVKGTVGGSRAIVDKGYIRRGRQIGQSGKSVSPKLMINFGISGQRQFTAGFDSAKTVISINKDKESTIFRHSDYGIVGDLYEILPLMMEKFKKLEW